MYILNEKDYIRKILSSGKKPDNLSISYLIVLIAKYYYDKDRPPEKLIDIVKKRILDFDIENYQEYKRYNKIKTSCENLYDPDKASGFRELEYIPIYQKEIELISTLPNDRQKKFMFTLYTIARYMNCGGWINKKDIHGLSEVFKLANVTLTMDKKNEMLHELYSNGYIFFGKKIDNLNIRVDLLENDETIELQNENIAYKVAEFKNIGNQYIGNFKKGYKQCKCCGKRIRNTGNRKMYCTKCAEEIDRNKAKDRMKTLRNS